MTNEENIAGTNNQPKVDVAVLILFFNRPEPLRQVFDEVRKARPSKLFLYQDGPRGAQDMEGIRACREVVEAVDWQCEVHKNYQKSNFGCDPSNYLAHKWAFSVVDKCIVFEDDSIPSQSFFPFCKELLDRYEHDERIGMIAGFNTDEVSKGVPCDYFFTSVFSIWGWASWRRVIDKWDAEYKHLDDKYSLQCLKGVMRQRNYWKGMLDMSYWHRGSGREHYESIFWSAMTMNSMLAIMPTRNMINNLGPVADSTHYTGSLATMPRRLRRFFTMRRFETAFPLRHPRYVIEDVGYKERTYRAYAYGHPWIKIGRSFEELFLNLRHGNLRFIWQSMCKRIKKIVRQ